MSFDNIKFFKRNCSHLASCLPGVKFVETKYGGYFQKGNRKLDANVHIKQKDDINESFKIRKKNNGFGIDVHPKDVGVYSRLRMSVTKALGIKD